MVTIRSKCCDETGDGSSIFNLMEMRIDKCEWCGAQIERASSGRRRRFCSGACRTAAYRVRKGVEWTNANPDSPDVVPAEPVAAALLGAMTSTDEQLYTAILNLSAVEIALHRLSKVARPEFAWRCAALAEAIAEARRKYFEGVLP